MQLVIGNASSLKAQDTSCLQGEFLKSLQMSPTSVVIITSYELSVLMRCFETFKIPFKIRLGGGKAGISAKGAIGRIEGTGETCSFLSLRKIFV